MASKRKRGGREEPLAPSDSTKKAKKSDKSAPGASAQPKLTSDKTPFIETPTGDERRREAGLYELLGNDDENERLEAADCIISSLLGGDGVPEPVLQRHLDRRLFRGLSSGRNASRLGFSLVITEILNQLFGEKALSSKRYPGLSFEKVLSFLVEQAQAIGNVPGQEERDHFFGQLFGVECFVKSHTLFKDISRWHSVLELILKLGYKKVWLRSQCGWVIVQAIEQMSQREAESTLERIVDSGLAKTPESVAIWLVTLSRFPDLKVKPWRNPLSNKSLGDLAAVLKESFRDQDKSQQEQRQRYTKQVNWTAQLHFVWDIILSHFLKQDSSKTDEFDQFWSRVVDDGLFSKNATDGQKFKGFLVLQKFLGSLVNQPAKLQCLFSKNLMTCLVNQAAKEDRYLHRAAIKTLKAVEGLVASNPDVLGPILQNLLSKNGVYNFDQRTNTKTVDKLLQSINANNETEALNIIRMPLAGLKKKEASDGQATLRTFIDYLSKCLNGLANSEGKTVMTTSGTTFGLVLQELGQLAYSQPNNIPSSLLTSQIREFCRTRLESSLARLARQGSEIGVFCTAVASIDSNAVTMDAEIRTSMEKASSRMHKLLKRKSKSDAERSLYHGLAMLHAVSIFQLFNEDPDAMEVLQDLSEFSEKLKMGSLSADGAGSSELLVEILLAMVTRPSSLMRQISHRVFEAFTGHISVEALGLLTGPLATGESTKGQKELFNTEDDAMDVDGEDESDEDEDDDVEDPDVDVDSDVEFVKLNGDDAEEDSDGGNDDDEGEEEEDEEGEEEDETTDGKGIAELDTLLGSILNSHRLDKDVEAESSESENDMSDSEMLARDEKLAAALKPHIRGPSNAKKQKKDAKQSVVNFKHRILDLLGIYVKNEALNPIAFSVLTPLLQLMRITSTKALANRACEVILDYQKGLKKARGNKEETGVAAANELLPLLVEVHEEAGKDNAHAYTKAASAASLIIVSAIFAAERDALKLVASVYTTTQLKWALGEAKSQTSFFVDWINWCQNLASQAHL